MFYNFLEFSRSTACTTCEVRGPLICRSDLPLCVSVRKLCQTFAHPWRGLSITEEADGLRQCGADEVWGKPFPSLADGSMQRRLAALFERAGRATPNQA